MRDPANWPEPMRAEWGLEAGFDMAYAYRPLHGDGVAHAFANTLLYLDLDRRGFDYPILPVTVNCYGREVIRNRGGGSQHATEEDPPAPSPRRASSWAGPPPAPSGTARGVWS